MKMFDKAIELSRQLLQEDPENLVVSVLLGKALMASGFPGHIEEGLALTFESLPQAIASDPDNALLYADLGQALDKAQQLTAITTDVQQTMDDSNRSTVLPYSLPFRRADRAYREALALDPQNTQVLFLMGQHYAFQNRADSSTVYYQRVLDSDPEHRAAQKQLAYQFLRQERIRESALLAEKILRQQLMDADGLYLKGPGRTSAGR